MTNVLINLTFILGLSSVLLITLTFMRLLLFYNQELAGSIPQKDLVRSFFIGCRFDMIITGVIMVVPITAQFFPSTSFSRMLPFYWCSIFSTIIVFMAVVELEFYQQFHTRLNSLVFEYIKEDPKTVTSMIWRGCPVLTYLSWWFFISILMLSGFFLVNSLTHIANAATDPGVLWQRLLIFLPLLVINGVTCRGTLRSGPPLR